MNIPTPLGKLIRLVRTEQSITQKELGDVLGVTSSFISAVETGKKTLPSDKLNLIVETYDLSADIERKLHAFAVIQSPTFTIRIPSETDWEKRKLAYLFSKKLPLLSEDDVEKIVEILNSNKGK